MRLVSRIRGWLETEPSVVTLLSLEKDDLPTYRAALGYHSDIVSRDQRFKRLTWQAAIAQDGAITLPDDSGVLPFMDGWRARVEYVNDDSPDELLGDPLVYTVRYEDAGKVRLIPID